jgi:hypothetical protein
VTFKPTASGSRNGTLTISDNAQGSPHAIPSANRDNAGTPENFKPSVIPGARGKGRTNHTGSYSGSAFID